jgi:hypothetical protein
MPSERSSDYISLIRSHFDRVLATGCAAFGPCPTAMWMASLDTRTGRYPVDDRRPSHIPKRAYRNIDAPQGCSLYWDQPLLVAAHALSALTGGAGYADAADAYVRDFLAHCVSGNTGIFLWGNHYYWDAFEGCVRRFEGEEEPVRVSPDSEPGTLHEIRPLPPAWQTFWRVNPTLTELAIRSAVREHLFDPESGGFNRHADRDRAYAFLEAGGILAESLGWLYARTADSSLVETARRIARFSWSKRFFGVNLVANSPLIDRWDMHACTTEVGLWAGSLVRAARYSGDQEFIAMAGSAVLAYLHFGWDARAHRYYGKLRTVDGTPVLGPKETIYAPDDYCDLWEPLFPRHDYPMALAETCVALHALTGKEAFRQAAARFADSIADDLPARQGRGAYAEHYGRCIHFLTVAGRHFGEPSYAHLARRVAAESIEMLYTGEMFRTHPGEDRYDAIDGLGLLALALLELQFPGQVDLMGFGF